MRVTNGWKLSTRDKWVEREMGLVRATISPGPGMKDGLMAQQGVLPQLRFFTVLLAVQATFLAWLEEGISGG